MLLLTQMKKFAFYSGYETNESSKTQISNSLSSFFMSLLTHDQVFIDASLYRILLANLDIRDIINLLDRKILHIIYRLSDNVLLESENKLELCQITTEKNTFLGIEKSIHSLRNIDVNQKSNILQFSDNAKVILPEDLNTIINKEVSFDLSSKTMKEMLNLNSHIVTDINKSDRHKILRTADIIRGLTLQNKLSITSIHQDGHSKEYINTKLNLYPEIAKTNSIETFSNILQKKGIPDVMDLYQRKIISIDNILQCRDSYDGNIFRKWFKKENYDENHILSLLLNGKQKNSNLSKTIRLIYPIVIGIVNPVAGALASTVDSFLVDKVINGWSPSLFLDNVLKNKIDKSIELSTNREEKNKMINRFGQIGRNEKCPCQSGKKFKLCHGKY